MQSIIAMELIERLNYIKINPKRILDIGSATGKNSILLEKIFPDAEIFELDFQILDMLKVSMNKRTSFKKIFSSKKDILLMLIWINYHSMIMLLI